MLEKKNLKELRESKILKQKDVAEYIGITTSYYGMIEQGVRTPKLDVALKIAKFFNASAESLFFNNQSNFKLDKAQESV